MSIELRKSKEPWLLFRGVSCGTDVRESLRIIIIIMTTNNDSVALVRERTIPTERPPLVGEVNANCCG
jgi:hypothetical protein